MKRHVGLFSIVYFLAFISYSFSISQLIPYLTTLGYNAFEKGVIISVSAIVTIILQMVAGYLSDHFKTIKRLFIVVLLVFGSVSYIVYRYEVSTFIITCILVSLLNSFFNLSFGFLDSWVLESSEYLRKTYSFIRAFGSLGWGIGSLLVSYIIVHFQYPSLGLSILLLCLLLVGIGSLLQDVKKQPHIQVQLSDYIKLIKKKDYVILLVVLFLVNTTQTLNTYGVVEKLVVLNATSYEIGLRNSIQGLIEIPIFIFGFYLLRKLPPKHMIKVACVMYAVQFVCFAFADSPRAMIYMTVLQIGTYPLLLMSQKYLLYDLSPEGLKTSGQLFAQSVSVGGPALLVPFLGGLMTSYIHVNATILFGAFASMVAFILLLWNRNVKKDV